MTSEIRTACAGHESVWQTIELDAGEVTNKTLDAVGMNPKIVGTL